MNFISLSDPRFYNMVVTVAQTSNFFEQQDQTGIPHALVIQLQAEEIQSVSDLADSDKDSLQQLADNLNCLGGWVPGQQ